MRTRVPMLPGICHATKFETHPFILGTDSPNLMLAKVSRYTVYVYVCIKHTHCING